MKEKILEGKVAVVAGSGQGIGRSIALGLGEAGAEVKMCIRDSGRGSALRLQLPVTQN